MKIFISLKSLQNWDFTFLTEDRDSSTTRQSTDMHFEDSSPTAQWPITWSAWLGSPISWTSQIIHNFRNILVGPWFATLIINLQNNVRKLKVHINSYLLDKNNLFCCDFAWLANNFTLSVISERSENRAVNNSRHYEWGTFDSRMWRH